MSKLYKRGTSHLYSLYSKMLKRLTRKGLEKKYFWLWMKMTIYQQRGELCTRVVNGKKKKKEGPDRIRTGDLLFTRQAL